MRTHSFHSHFHLHSPEKCPQNHDCFLSLKIYVYSAVTCVRTKICWNWHDIKQVHWRTRQLKSQHALAWHKYHEKGEGITTTQLVCFSLLHSLVVEGNPGAVNQRQSLPTLQPWDENRRSRNKKAVSLVVSLIPFSKCASHRKHMTHHLRMKVKLWVKLEPQKREELK